jgi:glycosyltransferase involved in cell wall biosynthesis
MNFYNWIWLLSVVFSILYLFVVVGFISGWNGLEHFQTKKRQFQTRVSLIMPFYNEEKTLESCVKSLLAQNIQTTFLEIILVDDNSSDGSSQLAEKMASNSQYLIYLQNNTGHKGKKAALAYGIRKAGGELIISTDADCIYPPHWLETMLAYYETYQPQMIIGPVDLRGGNSFFQKFQLLEYVSLMGSTGGSAGIGRPIMCNGANLAFTRKAYWELDDPFNQKYVSGDDVFLMHQLKEKYADEIHYLKSELALVYTKSAGTVKEFFKQRFRWTSKMPGYTDSDTLFIAGVIFSMSLLIFGTMVFMPFFLPFYKPFLFVYTLKFGIDLWFFWQISGFFKKKSLLVFLPLFEIVYAFYVVITAGSVLFRKKLHLNSH